MASLLDFLEGKCADHEVDERTSDYHRPSRPRLSKEELSRVHAKKWTLERRIAMSDKWNDPDYRAKMIPSCEANYEIAQKSYKAKGRGGVHSLITIPQGTFKTRSWIERKFLRMIETLPIESVECEPFAIPYVYDIPRNYWPDFLLDGKYLIEVKPQKFKSDPKVLAKCKAARSYCDQHDMLFYIMDRHEFNDFFQRHYS